MNRGFVAVLAACVVAAACSGDTTPTTPAGPGPVAVVNIGVVTSTMIAGATQQLTAKLYDKDGKAVTTGTVTWAATPATVATISAGGLLSAIAPGSARVTAASGAVTAAVDIQVDPDPCATPVVMRVGEVRTFTGGAAVSCVTLAASTGGSDYVFIGANTRPVQDSLLSFSVTVPIASADLWAPAVQAALDPRLLADGAGVAAADALHQRLRDLERARIGPVVVAGAAARARARAADAWATSARIAPPAVGDTVTIRVPNLNTGKDICKDNIPVKAVVRALSARATLLEDVATPAGGFTGADYAAIGQEFDALIFPTDTAWFGKPTDVNSDGRITIMFTPEVNKLTPAGSPGFTAGFFFGSDLIRKTEYPSTNECRNQTNEQEIFYLLSPDPGGQFNNVRSTSTVRQGTRGVIAHEFQHMLNQGVRQYNPAVQALETPWLNEAMSHLAEEITGRALLGMGDFQRLTFAAVNPGPTGTNDYNAFFRQNLARFQRWMQRPDTAAPVSIKNREHLAPRGASWALLRYAIDHYSGGAARAFTRALAAGPQTDVANFLARMPGGTQFDQVITGWLVANYADGSAIPGLGARFGYTSWNIRDAMSGVSGGTFPLQVNPLPGIWSGQALSSSGLYYRLLRNGASPQVQFRLLAPGAVTPLTTEFATVVVLRAQ